MSALFAHEIGDGWGLEVLLFSAGDGPEERVEHDCPVFFVVNFLFCCEANKGLRHNTALCSIVCKCEVLKRKSTDQPQNPSVAKCRKCKNQKASPWQSTPRWQHRFHHRCNRVKIYDAGEDRNRNHPEKQNGPYLKPPLVVICFFVPKLHYVLKYEIFDELVFFLIEHAGAFGLYTLKHRFTHLMDFPKLSVCAVGMFRAITLKVVYDIIFGVLNFFQYRSFLLLKLCNQVLIKSFAFTFNELGNFVHCQLESAFQFRTVLVGKCVDRKANIRVIQARGRQCHGEISVFNVDLRVSRNFNSSCFEEDCRNIERCWRKSSFFEFNLCVVRQVVWVRFNRLKPRDGTKPEKHAEIFLGNFRKKFSNNDSGSRNAQILTLAIQGVSDWKLSANFEEKVAPEYSVFNDHCGVPFNQKQSCGNSHYNLTSFPNQRKVTRSTRKGCGSGLEARLSKGARRATVLSGRVFSCAFPNRSVCAPMVGRTGAPSGAPVSFGPVFQPRASGHQGGSCWPDPRNQRRPAMSTTGDGRRASARPRDTPDRLFDLILKLQAEHYHLQGLLCALAVVVNELRETPDVSQLPAVTAAEALSTAMLSAQEHHLQSLEVLERARFGAEGEVG